jgi:predicted PurR-regulated permease PerM
MAIRIERFFPEQQPIARTLRLLLVAGLLILLFWFLGQVVLLTFGAVLLAVLLAVPAQWLSQRTGLGYGWCLCGLCLAVVLAWLAVIWALMPQVNAQIMQISTELPSALHSVLGAVQNTALGKMVIGRVQGGASMTLLSGPLLKSATTLFTGLGSIIYIIFVGLYLAAAPRQYRRGLLWLLPAEARERVGRILDSVGLSLKYFLFGRLFSMAVIAACSIVGLWLLGIPAPVALGLLAGVMSFVPYVGSAASGIPPVLLGYMQSPVSAAYVIALYIALHALDGYVLLPIIQRRMVHLPPALTLVAQMVMGVLWGILGVALATPLAAAAMAFAQSARGEDHGRQAREVARREETLQSAPGGLS